LSGYFSKNGQGYCICIKFAEACLLLAYGGIVLFCLNKGKLGTCIVKNHCRTAFILQLWHLVLTFPTGGKVLFYLHEEMVVKGSGI
jgi:hypothetical protein